MKLVKINNGAHAIIDDEDYEKVCKYTWHNVKGVNTNYAKTDTSRKSVGGRKAIMLHKLVCPNILHADHKDGNGLNCQKVNLRESSKSQNAMNQALQKRKKSSKFKGVYKHRDNRWVASTMLNKKHIYIGIYNHESDAAKAYDKTVVKLFGEFARTNEMLGLYV